MTATSTDSIDESPKLTSNAFKLNSNGDCVDDSMQTPHKASVPLQQRHIKSNHLNGNGNCNNDNDDVIRVLINGQPARFNANTIGLSKDPIVSRNNVNQPHDAIASKSLSSHNSNKSSAHIHTDKFTNNNSNHNSTSNGSGSNKSNSNNNAYEKSLDAVRQSKQPSHPQKYSDDAMHLPDIVVGSTLHASNINISNNNHNNNSAGSRKPIPLSRSPPKIVVNDNTLDSWSSNEEETGSLEESLDEGTEVDDDTSELTDVSANAICFVLKMLVKPKEAKKKSHIKHFRTMQRQSRVRMKNHYHQILY